MKPLKNLIIPELGAPGDFAYKRAYYWHSGLDLYCEENAEVFAIEDGEIVNISHFTGEFADNPTPHWNNTKAILIEGKSGALGYCELEPIQSLKIGDFVKEGDLIGNIVKVLKKPKGNPTSMLHFELYTSGTKEHVDWFHDKEKPLNLLNPRKLLESLK